MTESGKENNVSGSANGGVLQARDVIASTIILQTTGRRSVPVPRHVPPAHPVWVDRSRELAMLDGVAARPAPTRVLLSGVGGVGKTELAAWWLLTGQRASHPDGDLYADLSVSFDGRPPSAGHVLAGWLRALGVLTDDLPADVAGLTALDRSVTAEKSHLVLVDNVSSAALVRPLIPMSPTSATVATSRYRLRGLMVDGFQPVDLGCFDPRAGGLLPDALLGRPTPPSERGVLETLAALSRPSRRPGDRRSAPGINPCCSPTDLITHLDTDHGSVLAPRADEASVGGLLDMSYDDLDLDTARLYRLLGSHPGAEFTADPFAAVLDLPRAEVDERLTRLLDANLITPVADARYRQHDLVREHAKALAEEHDDPALRRTALRTMIEWYLRRTAAADTAINPRSRRFSPVYEHLDTEPFSNAEHALGWFAIERVNVLAAQYLAAQHGWDGLVFQLAEVVWNPLRPSYFVDDLVDTQQLGVDAAQRCQHLLEAVFLARLGFGETNRAHHEAAITACTRAFERASTFGDSWVQSTALSTRARALTAAGQPRAALVDLGSALTMDEQRGDRRSIALRHRRIGQAYAHPEIADFPQATWHLREAAEAMEALGDETAHARVVTYLAEAHVDARQPDAALFTLRRIESTLASCSSLRYRGHAYTVTGRAHAQLGNIAEADRCYRNALELCTEAGPGAAANRETVMLLHNELNKTIARNSREDDTEPNNTEGRKP